MVLERHWAKWFKGLTQCNNIYVPLNCVQSLAVCTNTVYYLLVCPLSWIACLTKSSLFIFQTVGLWSGVMMNVFMLVGCQTQQSFHHIGVLGCATQKIKKHQKLWAASVYLVYPREEERRHIPPIISWIWTQNLPTSGTASRHPDLCCLVTLKTTLYGH